MHQRSIGRMQIRDDLYEKYPKNILEVLSAHKMVGLLRQISQVSEFAGHIVSGAFFSLVGFV